MYFWKSCAAFESYCNSYRRTTENIHSPITLQVLQKDCIPCDTVSRAQRPLEHVVTFLITLQVIHNDYWEHIFPLYTVGLTQELYRIFYSFDTASHTQGPLAKCSNIPDHTTTTENIFSPYTACLTQRLCRTLYSWSHCKSYTWTTSKMFT